MIIFHVDDLKSSHVDATVNTDFEKWLQRKYGEHGKVKAHRGKLHDYLGMNFDYSEKGKVHIDMKSYVEDMINEFPIEMNKTSRASTPAAENLFDEGDGEKLNDSRREVFHKIVAKGLFVSKRASPNIHTMIATLCTRVKSPNESD